MEAKWCVCVGRMVGHWKVGGSKPMRGRRQNLWSSISSHKDLLFGWGEELVVVDSTLPLLNFACSQDLLSPLPSPGLTRITVKNDGFFEQHMSLHSFSRSCLTPIKEKVELKKLCYDYILARKGLKHIGPYSYVFRKEQTVLCRFTGIRCSGAKECLKSSEDCTDVSRDHPINDQNEGYESYSDHQTPQRHATYSRRGLAEACNFVYNDAKFVNERARRDIILLSRGITRLNDRARQDVAVLGLGFLKLDARAREDTEKIDLNVKRKAAHLNHIATFLKDKAQSDLKRAADQHWSDGALEADLRRADFVFKRRAMEDAYMALKFIQSIHDMMVNKQYQRPPKEDSFSVNEIMRLITLEKNGKALDLFAGEVSTDRITAIQDAYWSMASALSEADGIDYTDPEELELLVATLIDLDAMDGKSTVSLLAECSRSPDVNTRKALANALAAAPSMWILGNAGMGALQRLAQDSNPAVAAPASKAINELKLQWELEEGDSLRFMMNEIPGEDSVNDPDTDANNSSLES